MSDELGEARIKLEVQTTKSKYTRYGFITSEILKWIDDYHATLTYPSQWIFPGESRITERTTKNRDKNGNHVDVHLNPVSAYNYVKRMLENVGLKSSETDIYSQYGLRTFADSLLSKAGIDRKYVEMIIGHKSTLAAGFHYRDWEAAEEDFEKALEGNNSPLIFFPREVIDIKSADTQKIEARLQRLEQEKEAAEVQLERQGQLIDYLIHGREEWETEGEYANRRRREKIEAQKQLPELPESTQADSQKQ